MRLKIDKFINIELLSINTMGIVEDINNKNLTAEETKWLFHKWHARKDSFSFDDLYWLSGELKSRVIDKVKTENDEKPNFQDENVKMLIAGIENNLDRLCSVGTTSYWDYVVDNLLNFIDDDYEDINNQPQIRKLADYLTCAFDWSKTPQGYEYWAEVHNKLTYL